MQSMRGAFQLVLLGASLASAQTYPGQYPDPSQYPPGQYPPGQYPPGQYPARLPGGIPMSIPFPDIKFPHRKPKAEEKKPEVAAATANGDLKVNLATVEGTLRKLGEKDLLLQTTAARVLRFRLLTKTQFRNQEAEPMRDSLLHPGDRLTIHVNADDAETALRVVLVRPGTTAERESAAKPVEEARITTPTADDLGKVRAAAVSEPAPIEEDRPTLAHSDAGETTTPRTSGNRAETVIDEARSAAESFTAELPNFLVQQVTTRYASPGFAAGWQRIDVVTADVTCVKGKEEYKNIAVNGRPSRGPVESTGSWSTGEFAITLEDVLSPITNAMFTARGEERVTGRAALAYDMNVEHANSHWTLVAPDGRLYSPAYKGSIWIDKETRRVLRIEQKAIGMPDSFPYDRAESSLEYGYVKIEGRTYLLPVKGENMACMGGRSCSRNVIEFRNYRKFGAESNISFEK
jgi:hypothetical protein